MRVISRFGWVLVAAALGCANNYDFTRARRADGSFDAAVLRKDLDGQKRLVDGSWIPLVRLQVASFGENDTESYPPGFTAHNARFFGPLGSWMSASESYYDARGELFEQVEERELLWGLIWGERETLVRTPDGLRSETSKYSLFGLIHPAPEVSYSAGAEVATR